MAHSVQIEGRDFDSFSLCALRLALCVMKAVQSRVLWVRILYFSSYQDPLSLLPNLGACYNMPACVAHPSDRELTIIHSLHSSSPPD
jgi:hypothetical protein